MSISVSRILAQPMAMFVIGCACAQAPFSLDTSFRTIIQHQYVASAMPLSDGKVLISGAIRFPGDMSTRAGARLNPDGSRDASFPDVVYMGGKITPWLDRVYAGNGPGLRRVWLNGVTDDSFNMVGAPFFSALQGGDYHVFPDGRVLMSGAHNLDYPAGGYDGLYNLIWFTNTGYLDTTRVHRKGNGVVSFFKELPDGKFICSGTGTQFEEQPCSNIFQVHADGSFDSTFQSDVDRGVARCYLPLADGRVYAGGNFCRAGSPDDTLRLARFMPDGSLDPAFNPAPFTLGAIPNNGLGGFIFGLKDWGQGRLLVTGRFQYVDGQLRKGICVLDSTGTLTEEFDGCGVDLFSYMGNTTYTLYGAKADHDSTHYYIWGGYNGYDDGTTNDTLQRFVTRLYGGDITTAFNNVAQPPMFSLFPNPSSGSVTLQLEQVPHSAQLIVRDALGREVLRQRVSDHYTELALECSGVYLLELWDGSGRVATQRVVVE